jgi:hypothetical protein
MNRFSKKRKRLPVDLRPAVSIAVFLCILGLLLKGTSAMHSTADSSQIDSLRQAILRSAVHCYAMEGAYPESIDYLKEHYGISWDSSKYIVDYEITGSNLMPDVSVFAIGKGAD